MKNLIKWGILGCGKISKKFVHSMEVIKDSQVIAVASRTPAKAEQFASEFNIPAKYDNYEQLLQRDDIDAVYIATTHNFHFECLEMAIAAKKAILCEKPFTVNAREAEIIIKKARDNNVFLMEGMWTRFLPAMVQVRDWLKKNSIGKIRQIRADFGICPQKDPSGRLFDLNLAGGALLDTGIYPVSFASMVSGKKSRKIISHAVMGDTGVDEQSVYIFHYDDNSLAVLSSAIQAKLTNRAEIIGETGKIIIPPNFIGAQLAELHRFGNKNTDKVETDFLPKTGFSFEIQEVNQCLRKNKLESAIMPLDETFHIMQTLDEIRSDWGLHYSNDNI